MKPLYSLITMIFLFGGLNSANAKETEWVKYSKLPSLMKKMHRQGYYPHSAKCRNSPSAKVTARPEVKVIWKKKGRIKDGLVLFHKGNNLIYPFFPGSDAKKNWKLKKGNNFRAGASKSSYRCYVWIKIR